MKILVIEDDLKIVNVLRLLLKIGWPEAELVSMVNGEQGLAAVEACTPDAVILDLGLPDISGFEVLRRLRQFSKLPVLVLTVRSDEVDVVEALSLGADDYVIKPFRQLELLARLKTITRRHFISDEDFSTVFGPWHFGDSIHQLYYGSSPMNLTRIEGRIMRELIKASGKVVPYSRLAESIWGEDYPGSTDSLKVHIRRLRQKIESSIKKPDLLLNLTGTGYYLVQ